jgi:peptidoglycan/LPS O-acetylase OafA/YrhL
MSIINSRNGSMDFLRCCAILLVVMAHSELAYVGPMGKRYLSIGGTGVDLFFVLSGYLLGHQLFIELRETGNIDVRRFWIRRWMRTLPAYYVMLSLTMFWLFVSQKARMISPSYLTFLQNYLTDLPYYSVTWSLCVEEHFYLVIAPIILLCSRSRLATWFVVPLFLIVPLACRTMHWYRSLAETHVRWDNCALGVLIALVKVRLPNLWALLERLAPSLAVAGLVLFLQNGLSHHYPSYFVGFADPVVWAMIYSSWVLLANSSLYWSKQFQNAGIRYMADRSYSVYLLHPEILALSKRIPSLSFPLHLTATLLLSLAIAEVLFRFVERPINQARERFRVSRSRSLAIGPQNDSGVERSLAQMFPAEDQAAVQRAIADRSPRSLDARPGGKT